MSEISRYRSYTSYSEENGKLVPSIEPQEKDAKYTMTDKLLLVDRVNGTIIGMEGVKKLKTEMLPNITTQTLTNVGTK